MVQKQVLAPRMIQSMEILQLPLLALQERIEQEMEENPILEIAGRGAGIRGRRGRGGAGSARPRMPPPTRSANWSSTRRTRTRATSSG